MNQLLRRHSKVVVAAGVSAAVLLGGGAAYAAGGTGQGGASTAKPKVPKGEAIADLLVFGKVSSVTPPTTPTSGSGGTSTGTGAGAGAGTGPLANAGSISLTEPDGSTYTAFVLPRTKVYEYVGPGHKPVAEDLSAVKSGDEVGLYVRTVRRDVPTGTGSGTPGSSGSGPTSGPTPPTRVHVATRILDLTGTVPTTTTPSGSSGTSGSTGSTS